MKNILIVLSIFVLAFSARLVYVTTNETEIESDEVEYDRLAVSLVESKGYIATDGSFTSHRPPLYPFFLALIYKVFGHNYFIVKIIQAILGSLSVCILYLMSDKIFNRKTAVLTGIFSSFYMTFVVCTRYLYTETLFTFLLVLTTYLIIDAARPSIMRFSILGILSGFLTMVRSAGLFVPFIIVVALLIKMKGQKLILRRIAPSVLSLFISFAAVILPWTVRNYRAHGRFVLVSTNAGLNMYQAIEPVSGKLFGLGPRDEVAKKADTISNGAERNDFYARAALRSYRENPKRALKMFIMRFLFFWNIIDWEIIGGDVINYHYVFILPFAFLGTVYSLRDRREIAIILFLILYFTSFVLAFQGTPRYRMPIDGYIIMLGCYGIYGFINRQKNRISPLLSTSVYFLLTYLVYKYSLQTKYFVRALMEKIGLW